MEFNMDITTRDEIIFGKYEPDEYIGGCRDFKGIGADTLKKLIEMGFANPDDEQNSAPTIEEFIDFMERWEGYTAIGYVISDERDDYRVSVEGIIKEGIIEYQEELEDFVDTFRFADDFDIKGYAWFS